MEIVLYQCVVGACPKVLLYVPSGHARKDGLVIIAHPDEPEKGGVEMTPVEWNALIQNAKPIPLDE